MAPVTRTLSSAALLLLLLLTSLLFTSASDLAVAEPAGAPQTMSKVGTFFPCKVDTKPCFDLFRTLMHWSADKPATFHTCCPVICGMEIFAAASCLCDTFKYNFFGIEIDYHWSMSMVMNFCGVSVPKHFKCT
ncbi:hypothetical protein Salat_0925100 [Sesamum alatum]|uniref:Hydrophobic seed protein domain-containing protein n=1 Tax=Sesamum alatum TaxID=300844 RepID=A0AAE2CRA5_9LAMI|nr:hypothetical protein Salat_0925100 [Sesamum alatum]